MRKQDVRKAFCLFSSVGHILKAYQKHLISAFERKKHGGGEMVDYLSANCKKWLPKQMGCLKCQSDKYTEITY